MNNQRRFRRAVNLLVAAINYKLIMALGDRDIRQYYQMAPSTLIIMHTHTSRPESAQSA
jgi:hypothetical protein